MRRDEEAETEVRERVLVGQGVVGEMRLDEFADDLPEDSALAILIELGGGVRVHGVSVWRCLGIGHDVQEALVAGGGERGSFDLPVHVGANNHALRVDDVLQLLIDQHDVGGADDVRIGEDEPVARPDPDLLDGVSGRLVVVLEPDESDRSARLSTPRKLFCERIAEVPVVADEINTHVISW